ncbi:phosphoglycolate phosphatase [Sulfurimonas marina]|uniref:Phosphoglycolate phosphatase n=1 Tax=Sulfurimonas marina TaxID=2590551 RepID=A0A7M1AUU3_9BACT|nr:phosphoglycolate phosphatase [Sulfurimonas marina]QOP41211.1 phosphoglycolate phosphatase [Sulfurimonas marina]
MKFSEKKLIIFDFDGTLIDSVPDLAASVNFMLKKLNKKLYSIDEIREWVGNGAQTLVKRALTGKKDFQEEEVNKNLYEQGLPIFLESYEEKLCEHTYLYEGVKETLEDLKQRGYKMAIVTNKPYKFILPILEALGIEEYFELLLGADSLASKKPSAEPLLHAMNHFECNEKECVMVGDSKNDIIAANNANMHSIAVSYGYNYGEDISVHQPSIIIENFADIIKHLEV